MMSLLVGQHALILHTLLHTLVDQSNCSTTLLHIFVKISFPPWTARRSLLHQRWSAWVRGAVHQSQSVTS
jgi:hypothetical protein